jgi:hypothetical protein
MARPRTRLVTEQYVPTPKPRQLPFLIRFIWFATFGWWLGLAWACVCLLFTLLGGFLAWPIMERLWSAVPTLLWLERH